MKPAIKGTLFLFLSLAGSVLFLSEAPGQSRPGGGVTGMAGRPPGFTGGATGANIGGPRPGITGGVTGTMSGTRPGGVTGGVSGLPPGTAIGGVGARGGAGLTGGAGITGGSAFGPTFIYTCPNCKREVGRGNSPPAMVSCCGQTYLNGKSLNFGQAPAPREPVGGVNPPTQPFQPFPAPGTNTEGNTTSTTSSGGVSGTFLALGVGVVLFGLVILGGVIVLIVQSQKSAAPAPRRRPRDDDY